MAVDSLGEHLPRTSSPPIARQRFLTAGWSQAPAAGERMAAQRRTPTCVRGAREAHTRTPRVRRCHGRRARRAGGGAGARTLCLRRACRTARATAQRFAAPMPCVAQSARASGPRAPHGERAAPGRCRCAIRAGVSRAQGAWRHACGARRTSGAEERLARSHDARSAEGARLRGARARPVPVANRKPARAHACVCVCELAVVPRGVAHRGRTSQIRHLLAGPYLG